MRFSLLNLLATVTLLVVCLAMYMPHGWFGIVLLLPHLGFVIALIRLYRKRRWRMVGLCVISYLGLWLLTASIAVQAVRQDMQARLAELHATKHGPLKTLDYDPVLDDSRPSVEPPWYFLGNETAPCPFIVTVDYGCMLGRLFGSGGKAYYFWFFGYKFWFRDHFLWNS